MQKMKKYKHKQTGKIVESKLCGVNQVKGVIWGDWKIPMWVIESSNDWEEVVEEDYEILSFTDGYNICSKYLNGLFTINTQYYYEERDLLENKSTWNIRSIRRTSDGEIFTIGDNTKYGCIDSFYIKNNYLLTTTVLESNSRYLKDLQKIKNSLFTTEDNVEIFEGDEYWLINKDLYNLWLCKAKERTQLNTYHKAFSTKKAAENFIKINKPCLSYNDVLGLYRNLSLKLDILDGELYKSELSRLVKEKNND